MLTFEEARARIVAQAKALGVEEIAVEDADGRVLAEDVVSRLSMPPFAASAMDGYAVRAGDFAPGTTRLPVSGEAAAGAAPAVLRPGSAMRIFTGGPLPAGADAVLIQESARREGDDLVTEHVPSPGDHVRRVGDDLEEGALVAARGTRVNPALLALLASSDHARVRVARRPRVAVLATGDELRDPGGGPRPGSIPESNAPAIAALARRLGAEVLRLPRAADDAAETEARVADALSRADVLLTVGGVSVGDHDVVRPALERAGVTIDFWKVAIKPGKPLCVGRRGEAWVLGLPGNPVSALVTMTLFGAPLLRALSGDVAAVPSFERARLAAPIRRKPGRTEFLRGMLARGLVTIHPKQSSAALVGLAAADVLAVLPPDAAELPAGAEVDVLRLVDAW